MTKVRNTLLTVLFACGTLGVLTVASHAKKPSPPPEPTVSVNGAITAKGDPYAIRVTFVDSSLVEVYEGREPCWFVSNPDYPPSLKIVLFMRPTPEKMLRYYYCDHPDHTGSDELICENPEHDPDHYFCLTIGPGITQKKNPTYTDHVVFPEGTPWKISWKYDNITIATGELSIETTYDLTRSSAPGSEHLAQGKRNYRATE